MTRQRTVNYPDTSTRADASPTLGPFITDAFERSNGGLGSPWFTIDAVNQKAMQIVGGNVFGTAAAVDSTHFNDANACITGFGLDYEVDGTLYINPAASGSGNREVEILLRAKSITPRDTGFGTSGLRTLELNTNTGGGYVYLSRMFDPGPLLPNAGPVGAWSTGDRLVARIQGQRIRVWMIRSGVTTLLIDYTDVAAGFYADGDPGIGAYCDIGNPVTDFGFSTVTVRAL